MAKNTRSTYDKTSHLVLSFGEGDRPGPETMARIEEEMAAYINYGEHQRISVVHADTNNCLFIGDRQRSLGRFSEWGDRGGES